MKPHSHHHTMAKAFSLVSLFYVTVAFADPLFISPDGSAVITATPITPISSTSIDSSLITSTFPGWSVVDGGNGPGAISTSTYTAGGDSTAGGAQIIGSYSSRSPKFGWIQIVISNDPLAGDPRSPRVDVLPVGETTTPFVPPSFVNPFGDFSKRKYSDLASLGAINWSANLYPADLTGVNTATVYKGINWGWQMKKALTGDSSGMFFSPSPSCPPAACSGVGTSSFSWGTPMPDVSSLSFQQIAFDPKPGEVFSLGKLTFHNGTIASGSGVDGINFDIGINLTNLPSKSTTLHTALALVNTPNTSDPIASSDYVNFTSGGFMNSFNVFEGATAVGDLLAEIDSSVIVHPQGTPANLSDEVPMLTSSDVSYSIRLIGWGNISAGGFQEAIPGDPTTIVTSSVPQARTACLLVSGLVLLVYLRRRGWSRGKGYKCT